MYVIDSSTTCVLMKSLIQKWNRTKMTAMENEWGEFNDETKGSI